MSSTKSLRNHVYRSPSSQSPSNKRTQSPSFPNQEITNRDSLHDQLNKYRQNLENKLQKYTIFHETNNPLKCLKHDTYISLYDQRNSNLLCISCYNEAHEKKKPNRVMPVQKSKKCLSKDIDRFFINVRQQVLALQKIEESLYLGFQEQINAFHKHFNRLETQNRESIVKINQYYQTKKDLIIQMIEEEKQKHQSIIKQIANLKQAIIDYTGYQQPEKLSKIYKYETKSKYENKKLFWQEPYRTRQLQEEDTQDIIYKHLILKELATTLRFSQSNYKWDISRHRNQIQKFGSVQAAQSTKVQKNLDNLFKNYITLNLTKT